MTGSDELIQGYLDGVQTAEQEAELNTWVKQNPVNARTFASAVRLHDQLRNAMQVSRSVSPGPAVPQAKSPGSDNRPWRPWRPVPLVSAITTVVFLLFLVLWWSLPEGANAATELDRMIETPSAVGDRLYQVTSLDEERKSGEEHHSLLDGAMLYVRYPDQYVLVRHNAEGGRFVTGSDGVRSWAARPSGAVRVSNDPLRFRGPLPGQQHGIPFADIRSDLVQIREAYALKALPQTAGLRGLLAQRKPTAGRGAREVELWYDPRTLVIHRMVFRGLPRARGGPDSVSVELVNQNDLGPTFFQHQSHHGPDRRVIEED